MPAEDLHLVNCYAEGFSALLKGTTSDYNTVLLTGCRLISNGSATGILIQGGSGGTLSINHSIIDVGTNNFAMNLFNGEGAYYQYRLFCSKIRRRHAEYWRNLL